jgi:hypothetical protein
MRQTHWPRAANGRAGCCVDARQLACRGFSVGTVPTGQRTATFLTAGFRASDHSGFIDSSTIASTQDPSTRELYLINSHSANTLEAVTSSP